MRYRTYALTGYSNVYSTGTAADGGATYHQVGSRSGRYYRRRYNVTLNHEAVADVEQIDAEAGQALLEEADGYVER